MTSRDFCFWLQGFIEMTPKPNGWTVTPHQMMTIVNHLNMVFQHEIDPSMPDKDGKLQTLHDGGPLWPNGSGSQGVHDGLIRC